MNLYRLEPEVAGGWGQNTVIENRAELESGTEIVPRISQLEYAVTDWLGDDLVTTAPCYLVTEPLANALSSAGITGFTFANVEVTQSSEFMLRKQGDLPTFRWLKISGSIEMDRNGALVSWSGDDICFATTKGWAKPANIMLVLSLPPPYFLGVTETCLNVMKQFRLRHCQKKRIATVSSEGQH